MEKDENDLNKAYSELYKSLGIEPGLLSKTTIGKNINKKFRDDSIDALITGQKYLNKYNKNEKPVIEDSSPFHNLIEIKLPLKEEKENSYDWCTKNVK